jgi:hypothetical protein
MLYISKKPRKEERKQGRCRKEKRPRSDALSF